MRSQFQEKYGPFHWEITFFRTIQECYNVTTDLLSNFCYLSSGRLREVKNKRKFQTFSFKSGRRCLREVVTYKSFQI